MKNCDWLQSRLNFACPGGILLRVTILECFRPTFWSCTDQAQSDRNICVSPSFDQGSFFKASKNSSWKAKTYDRKWTPDLVAQWQTNSVVLHFHLTKHSSVEIEAMSNCFFLYTHQNPKKELERRQEMRCTNRYCYLGPNRGAKDSALCVNRWDQVQTTQLGR